MDVQALRYFVATIEAGSFAGAAARLGLTQPSVSRQVRLLERELGVPLVAAIPPRRLVPTPSGEMLLAGARQLMVTLERLRQDALDKASEPMGPLAVAAPPATGLTLLQSVLPEFLRRYPRVQLRVLTGYSGYIEDWLRSGEADIGFLYGDPVGGDLETKPLLEIEMFLIVPSAGVKGHDAPAEGATCTLAEIAALPMVLPHTTQGIRKLVDRSLVEAGFDGARVVVEVDDPPLLKSLVQAGVGFSILGYGALRQEVADGSLRAIPIAEPGVRWSMSSARRRDRQASLAAVALLRMVEEAAQRLIASGELRGRDLLR